MTRSRKAVLAAGAAAVLLLSSAPVSAEELPAALDPRPDQVSAIREQYWGTCWGLGGISTLESYLIKNGLADTSVDLSDEDVLWWANGNYSDTDPENPDSGFGWTNLRRNDGGYAAMTTGYLATVGARAESDIPYLGAAENPDDDLTNDYYYQGTNQKPANYDTAPVLYQVTDLAFFDSSASPETIKQAVLDYGAVTVSYYDSTEYFHQDTASYWYPGGEALNGNHTVSLVGWDDGYPKENFTTADGRTPEADGAWLIKNSYGTDYGSQGGYTWISYEDAMLFETVEYNQMYAVAGARVPEERHTYLADEYGAVSSYSPEVQGSFTCANVFEFGQGETLSEAMFMTWSQGAAYELYYAPAENGVPAGDSSQWTLLSQGTVEHAGYTTVELENPLEVPAGAGALILSLEGENLNIGTDEPLLEGSRPMFNAKIQRNVSYFLEEGGFQEAGYEAVTDFGDTYTQPINLSLRAYTVDTPDPTEEPEPTATAAPTETPAPTETAVPTETPVPTGTENPTGTAEPETSGEPTGTQTPEKTKTPVSGDKVEDSQNVDASDTGDHQPIEAWAMALIIAGAALAVLVIVILVRKHMKK